MPRVRTFIALDPGPAIRDRMITLQKELARAGADVKWVEPDNLHITLLFLGEVEDRDLVSVCQAVTETAETRGAFEVSIEGAGCFPNMRRPRVVWLGVGRGAADIAGLHDALEEPLLQLGCYRREERKYTPHVTLGRVQGDESTDALSAALLKNKGYQAGTADIREVQVMSSELSPRGPVYTVMSRARLG
jgi:2'-5' RNA ligase